MGRRATLVQHFAESSREHAADACAVHCPREGRVSYDALGSRSDRLSHALAAAGVGRGSRVAICLGRSASSVVALLGALKADAVAVPLDERSAAARLERILDDCAPRALVVDEPGLERLAGLHAGTPRVLVGPSKPGADAALTMADVEAQPPGAREWRNVDTDLACILYTSGSTGSPKGVTLSHRNLVGYAAWGVEYFGIDSAERILGTAPFHFDMSAFDLYCAQAAGASLCLASVEDTMFPARLVQLMQDREVTLWKAVASLPAYLARVGALRPGTLPALRQVLFSGERLPVPALAAWMSAFPEKRFYNVYGPTEATGISTVHPIDAAPARVDEPVPIGRPCANKEVLLLDAAGLAVPAGEIGEICIRGSCLSPGYWNDPERTRQVFVAHPAGSVPGERIYRSGDLGRRDAQGVLHFVGRRDEQVKWMGYRIELGEIVAALEALPPVAEAAVLLLPGRVEGTDELVAFVALAAGGELAAILPALRRALPGYMLPRRVLPVDALPRSDRGKIDRRALERVAWKP